MGRKKTQYKVEGLTYKLVDTEKKDMHFITVSGKYKGESYKDELILIHPDNTLEDYEGTFGMSPYDIRAIEALLPEINIDILR